MTKSSVGISDLETLLADVMGEALPRRLFKSDRGRQDRHLVAALPAAVESEVCPHAKRTDDDKKFSRIDGLRVENWLRDPL